MPVRIVFTDPAIKVHVCPDELKDHVIADIAARYNGVVKKIIPVESIHIDPGGMAFIEPEIFEFEVEGVKYTCNAEHLNGVIFGLSNCYRLVDSPYGKLARVYMYWDLLVIPAGLLWQLLSRFQFHIEEGTAAAEKIAQVLADANALNEKPDENNVH